MKRFTLAVLIASALAGCSANAGLGLGTGGGLGLGAGLSFPVGGKTEAKAAPALSSHIVEECGKFAANVHATSEEAALKMCKRGASKALKPNGDELCARNLESLAKEQPSQTGPDHDVFAENTAAFAYGCDVAKASKKGEDLQGNAISDDEEDDAL